MLQTLNSVKSSSNLIFKNAEYKFVGYQFPGL